MAESAALSALVVGLGSSGPLGFSRNFDFEFIVSLIVVVHGLDGFIDVICVVENLGKSGGYDKGVVADNADFLDFAVGGEELFELLFAGAAAEPLHVDLKLAHKLIQIISRGIGDKL
jgi:hypothetical protein